MTITAMRHDQALLSSTPAVSKATLRATLGRDDFVLLTDNMECWIVRIGEITTLEAQRDETLVRFAEKHVLIRRSLEHCEGRLDDSIFFRASRGCIVNVAHLSRPRLQDGCLIFLGPDGREIVFSRRQTAVFRTRRRL